MKKTILSLFLSVAMMLSCSTAAFAAKITGVYREDREATLENYSAAYGWDTDLLEEPQWSSRGEQFTRQRGYQVEFYRDNITTTFLQLGLTPGSYGGGGSMVAIALAEVGAEGSVETPKGSNNVKYNTWYYGHSVSGKDYPWCAAFISWCAEQAGYLESGLFTRTASSTGHYNYLTGTMGLPAYDVMDSFIFGGYYTPVPGDIQLFRDNSGFCHIGIIVEVTDSGWYTVEGNSGNQVRKNFYDSSCSSTARRGSIVNVAYPVDTDKNEQAVFTFLTRVMKLNSAVACGIMGSLSVASGFDPSKVETGKTMETGGYGIAQWRGGRSRTLRTDVQRWGSGLNDSAFTTVEGQLWFMKWELEKNYGSILRQLKDMPDTLDGAKSACELWMKSYEMPGVQGAVALNRRSQETAIFWQRLGNHG